MSIQCTSLGMVVVNRSLPLGSFRTMPSWIFPSAAWNKSQNPVRQSFETRTCSPDSPCSMHQSRMSLESPHDFPMRYSPRHAMMQWTMSVCLTSVVLECTVSKLMMASPAASFQSFSSSLTSSEGWYLRCSWCRFQRMLVSVCHRVLSPFHFCSPTYFPDRSSWSR